MRFTTYECKRLSERTILLDQEPLAKPLSYEEHIKKIKRDLETTLDEGKSLDAMTVTSGLLEGHCHKAFRAWAAKKGVPNKDFDAALRTHQIIRALGATPTSPQHFIELILARDAIHCRFNGLIGQAPRPQVTYGSKLVEVAQRDQADPAVATLAHFTSPKTMTTSEFTLGLRTTAANLKLGFSDTAIRDAVEMWMRKAKRERLASIYLKIQHTNFPRYERERVEAMWLNLCAKTFDTSDVTVEFVVAVLRKFVWAVKRKMLDLIVTNHIMVVLLGPQGVGKTVFVRSLVGPVVELSLEVDFATLEEARNIEIWRFFVHILDEMGYATKTDSEAIKRVLTADTLSRRPMGSNSVETVPQKATMIGCSNKELDQLINDPTGNRRFVPLRFRRDADWAAINATDYLLLWQSVDEHGPDPMIEHMGALKELQAASRQLGPVEQWLAYIADQGLGPYEEGEKVMAAPLYERFRVWEQSYRPGRSTDMSAWSAELRRLLKNDRGVDLLPLRRADQRTKSGYPYVLQNVENVQP